MVHVSEYGGEYLLLGHPKVRILIVWVGALTSVRVQLVPVYGRTHSCV